MTSDGMFSIKEMIFKIWSATVLGMSLEEVWKGFVLVYGLHCELWEEVWKGFVLVYGLHRQEKGLERVWGIRCHSAIFNWLNTLYAEL